MSTSLTLYDLSAELVSLMDTWDDPAIGDEERADVEKQLQAFAEAHVRKVDNVRAYLRHCEQMVAAAREEQARQKQHADAWQARYDRLKEACKYVMQTFKAKRFDGNTGSLLLKANGGKQAVTITDESLIPDEYLQTSVKLPRKVWDKLTLLAFNHGDQELVRFASGYQAKIETTPLLSLIEAALQKPCEICANYRDRCADEGVPNTCPACGGSGKAGVPGARLEPRGEHIEVK